MEKKSKSIKRIITSIIGFPPIASVLIFANTYIMDIFVAIIAIISMYEYFNCFKAGKKANPSSWYGYILCVLIAFTHLVSKKLMYEVLIAIIPISLLVLIIELIFSKGKKNILDVAVTMLGICYIPTMILFLSLTRESLTHGRILVWYVFFSAWGSDIFAYFIGKNFGKHKFTQISPNKTIEGCVAGVIGALIFAIIYTIIVNNIWGLGISYVSIILITILLSIIGQIGDLAASSIKRYCGLKDFSELIPGHGGMLDRIDSIIFILPFAYILLKLI